LKARSRMSTFGLNQSEFVAEYFSSGSQHQKLLFLIKHAERLIASPDDSEHWFMLAEISVALGDEKIGKRCALRAVSFCGVQGLDFYEKLLVTASFPSRVRRSVLRSCKGFRRRRARSKPLKSVSRGRCARLDPLSALLGTCFCCPSEKARLAAQNPEIAVVSHAEKIDCWLTRLENAKDCETNFSEEFLLLLAESLREKSLNLSWCGLRLLSSYLKPQHQRGKLDRILSLLSAMAVVLSKTEIDLNVTEPSSSNWNFAVDLDLELSNAFCGSKLAEMRAVVRHLQAIGIHDSQTACRIVKWHLRGTQKASFVADDLLLVSSKTLLGILVEELHSSVELKKKTGLYCGSRLR
jgi:hypothetical protein